jgi:hypothetical protein
LVDVQISAPFANAFVGMDERASNQIRAALAQVLDSTDVVSSSISVQITGLAYNVTFFLGISGVTSSEWYGPTYARTFPSVVAARFAEIARVPPDDVACGYPSRDAFLGATIGRRRATTRRRLVSRDSNRRLLALWSSNGTMYPEQPPFPSPPPPRPTFPSPPPPPRPPSPPPFPPPVPSPPPSPPPQLPPMPLVVPVHVIAWDAASLRRFEFIAPVALRRTPNPMDAPMAKASAPDVVSGDIPAALDAFEVAAPVVAVRLRVLFESTSAAEGLGYDRESLPAALSGGNGAVLAEALVSAGVSNVGARVTVTATTLATTTAPPAPPSPPSPPQPPPSPPAPSKRDADLIDPSVLYPLTATFAVVATAYGVVRLAARKKRKKIQPERT